MEVLDTTVWLLNIYSECRVQKENNEQFQIKGFSYALSHTVSAYTTCQLLDCSHHSPNCAKLDISVSFAFYGFLYKRERMLSDLLDNPHKGEISSAIVSKCLHVHLLRLLEGFFLHSRFFLTKRLAS